MAMILIFLAGVIVGSGLLFLYLATDLICKPPR